MTTPHDNRPTHPLDLPFVVAGALVLFVLFAPLQHLVIRHTAAPPVDARAAFERGATAMCFHFADEAGVARAQAESVCADLARGLE
jgi:hypothetical protein